MNIRGFDKAKVLSALYNRARAQGLGFLEATPNDMQIEEAQKYLDSGQKYFDYLKGRVMKISLEEDEVSTRLYNRDNGPNAAEEVLENLKKT